MSDKFDDCRFCEHRRTDMCEDCDAGELFEPIDDELDFNDPDDVPAGGFEEARAA